MAIDNASLEICGGARVVGQTVIRFAYDCLVVATDEYLIVESAYTPVLSFCAGNQLEIATLSGRDTVCALVAGGDDVAICIAADVVHHADIGM